MEYINQSKVWFLLSHLSPCHSFIAFSIMKSEIKHLQINYEYIEQLDLFLFQIFGKKWANNYILKYL